MPYINYTPTGTFARAMFNFDAMGGTNYKFSGTVRVSVSDAFSYSDFQLGRVNDPNLTSGLLANEIVWPASTIDNIKETLTVISQFANITFDGVTDYDTYGTSSICNPANVGLSSDINICYMNANSTALRGQSGSNSDYMGYTGSRGDIFVNKNATTFVDGITFADYTKSRQTLMHELGHSLGLSHSFDSKTRVPTSDFTQLRYAGFGALGFKTSSGNDINKEYFTIMSYDDQSLVAGLNAYTPMIFDVIALQAAYGEGAGTTGSGNDSILAGTIGYRTYFDKGGTDTVDLNLYQSGAYLNMGVTISGAPHLVGVSMSVTDGQTTVVDGGNPSSLRWFYGEFENANGSKNGDIIIGNYLDNTINGGDGNDYLSGDYGNDSFDWDPSLRGGNDTFEGGPGDDTYVVDSLEDVILENDLEGIDTVFAGFNYSILNTALENIKTFSNQSIAVSFTGNTYSNILEGGSGNDTLSGYEGSDTLIGGAGNDLIYGGTGPDTAKFMGARSEYEISQDASGLITVVDRIENRDGTDKLSSVEFLSFSDITVSGLDFVAPTVTTFNPLDEATGVAIGTNIVVTFNEAIQRGTGSILLKTGTGAIVATFDAATSANLSIAGSTLTINPTADLSYGAAYKVEFAAGTIKDLAGNLYSGTTTYNFSTVANATSVAAPTLAAGASGAIEVTIGANATAASLYVGAINISSKFATTKIGSVVVFRPQAGQVEYVAAAVTAKAADSAGNLSGSSTTLTYSFDNVAPAIAISSSVTSLSVGKTATLNFEISESVSDFIVGDITVSGGALSNFSGSGTSYTATFTPTANSTANGVVSVSNGKFSDSAGNFNVDGSDANNTVTILVNSVPVNTAPAAIAASFATDEDVARSGTLVGTDAESNPLTFSKVSDPTHGTVVINATTGAFTYTPAKDYNGADSFTFKVNDAKLDSVPATVTLKITAINDLPTGLLSIDGTVSVGRKLTANSTLADVDGLGTLAYQWSANGLSISGAKSSQYLLAAGDVGKTITVTASYTDQQGTSESVTSAVTAKVMGVNAAPSGSLVVSGIATEGQVLSATTDGIADTDGLGVISTRWQVSNDGLGGWTDLSSPNGTSLSVKTAQVGLYARAVASYTDGLGLPEIVYSSPSHRIGAVIVGTSAGETLKGTTGDDRLEGGLGDDVYVVADQTDLVIEAEGQGTDTVIASSNYYLWSNVENLTLAGTASLGVGNALDNVLVGNNRANVLVGAAGNDTIDGGPGVDLMYGNTGDDTFYVSEQADRVFENPNEGYDTVIADSADGFYLPANVEALTLVSTTPFGIGNELNNLIKGNTSANVLVGGLGNDTLDGGEGFDILWGEAGADTFLIRKGTGMDIIADFTPGTDLLDVREYAFKTTAAFLARMTQVGTDISIDLGGGDSLILMGVSMTSLGVTDLMVV